MAKGKSNKTNFTLNCNKQNIPLYNFFENLDLDVAADLEECLDDLLFKIDEGYFLQWEAVIRQEQGMKLTKKQQEAIDAIMFFSDDENEQVLYIDEFPRPCETWYETLNKIISRLILTPFTTYEIHYEIYHDGWQRIVETFEENAHALPLPENVNSPFELIPAELLHHLWLQDCFNELGGLGQEEELTLANNNQKKWRIEGFIKALQECKDSVEYLDVTLEKLFELVKLPPTDEKILIEAMMQELKIKSLTQKLKDVLN